MLLREFVLQEHLSEGRAQRHYDFRIRYPRKSDLISWALPKAKIPKRIGDKVLAVRTPDHDKSWLKFYGRIGSGYGKGMVKIEQTGYVQIEAWDERNQITFTIDGGSPLDGRYSIIKMKNQKTEGQEDWLLIKAKDKK